MDRQIEIEEIALLDGTLLEDVTPNADGAVTIVPHKLNRPWRGYLVTRQKYSGNESMTTAAFTPTALTSQTTTHGLGGRPTSFYPHLVNLTAELGYTAGDVVALSFVDTNVASEGFGLYMDDATTFSVVSIGIQIYSRSGLAAAAITAANWAMYIRADRPRSLVEVTNKTSNTDRSKYLYLKGRGFTGTDKVDIWVF